MPLFTDCIAQIVAYLHTYMFTHKIVIISCPFSIYTPLCLNKYHFQILQIDPLNLYSSIPPGDLKEAISASKREFLIL